MNRTRSPRRPAVTAGDGYLSAAFVTHVMFAYIVSVIQHYIAVNRIVAVAIKTQAAEMQFVIVECHQPEEELSISEKTVRNHVSHIYDKLGVRSRAEALVLARRQDMN